MMTGEGSDISVVDFPFVPDRPIPSSGLGLCSVVGISGCAVSLFVRDSADPSNNPRFVRSVPSRQVGCDQICQSCVWRYECLLRVEGGW